MKYFMHLFCLAGAVLTVTACEHGLSLGGEEEKQDPVVIFHDPEPVMSYDMTQGEMAQALSNENVIVYPIDGQIADNKREFPEYRGVLDNTTAGGYTVFDPSVMVYAVEGVGDIRPSYLPRYSVPQYAEQYRSAAVEPAYNAQAPLTPISTVPLQTPTPIAPRAYRPWVENQEEVNVGTPRAPQQVQAKVQPQIQPQTQTTARRSPPMLTGY